MLQPELLYACTSLIAMLQVHSSSAVTVAEQNPQSLYLAVYQSRGRTLAYPVSLLFFAKCVPTQPSEQGARGHVCINRVPDCADSSKLLRMLGNGAEARVEESDNKNSIRGRGECPGTPEGEFV